MLDKKYTNLLGVVRHWIDAIESLVLKQSMAK
jgi:hypothetical protein